MTYKSVTKISLFRKPPYAIGTKLIIRWKHFWQISPKTVSDTKGNTILMSQNHCNFALGTAPSRKLNQDVVPCISVSDTIA